MTNSRTSPESVPLLTTTAGVYKSFPTAPSAHKHEDCSAHAIMTVGCGGLFAGITGFISGACCGVNAVCCFTASYMGLFGACVGKTVGDDCFLDDPLTRTNRPPL